MSKKGVYLFREGNATMRDLLGGKGANLAEMTNIGLPVPPGFTITTEMCNEYIRTGKLPAGLMEQVQEALADVEREMGKKLGDPANPLLLSVRSGAKFSMPGMMDTVLNLGLNDESVLGVAKQTDDERFAYDSYRRFISMYGRIVQGIAAEAFDEPFEKAKEKAGAKDDSQIPADALHDLVDEYKGVVKKHTKKEFPQNPLDQLKGAIEAVFKSWNGAR